MEVLQEQNSNKAQIHFTMTSRPLGSNRRVAPPIYQRSISLSSSAALSESDENQMGRGVDRMNDEGNGGDKGELEE